MKRLCWLVSLVAFAASCSADKPNAGAGPATTASASVTRDAPGPSIYPLSVNLRDQRDQAIRIDAFRGHPVIVSMFFGSCPTACPLIVSHIKRIEGALSPSSRADLRILLVSFDPAQDTPKVLAGIAKARGLDEERWTLATGNEDDVRQIAAALRVSYRALPTGGFVHDSVLTVLDRDGRIMARTDEGDDTKLVELGDAIGAVEATR